MRSNMMEYMNYMEKEIIKMEMMDTEILFQKQLYGVVNLKIVNPYSCCRLLSILAKTLESGTKRFPVNKLPEDILSFNK